jgi:hypothetical protein
MTMRTEKSALLAAVAAVTLSIAAPFARPTAEVSCIWDNNVITDGVSGRALSPPSFPNIRVVDDFVVPLGGCIIEDLALAVIEDTTWEDGGIVEVSIRRDGGGGPQRGEEGIVERVLRPFSKAGTGDVYFGRTSFEYYVEDVGIPLSAGRYWLGVRNPLGNGSGTNYWITSDGGPDGMESSNGYFSLDGGETFQIEGLRWHHAFVITTGLQLGACCQPTSGCVERILQSRCGGRFFLETACADVDPPCGTGACCTSLGICTDRVVPEECDGRFTDGVFCADLDPPCEPAPPGEHCPIQKFFPIDREAGENFGEAVALRDGRALIGAPHGRVNGQILGEAYIFEPDERGGWIERARLIPQGISPRADFGRGVALGEDLAVVGTPERNSVFIFSKEAEGWRQLQHLNDIDPRTRDFGEVIVVEGRTIFVGDSRYGNDYQGAVFIFQPESKFHWAHVATIEGESRLDGFGRGLAAQGDLLVVGAPYTDDPGYAPGSVWVFERRARDSYVVVAKLHSNLPGERSGEFGRSVALEGDTIAVGAYQADNGVRVGGAVHVFERLSPGGDYRLVETIFHPDGVDGDAFGLSIALRGDLLLVGAPNRDDRGEDSGAAFLYRRLPRSERWILVSRVSPRDGVEFDRFARSVALDDRFILAGAGLDDVRGENSGSAHVFSLICPDFDASGTVDLDDYRYFHDCLTGPGGEVTPSCLRADLDFDGDADLMDYRVFQEALPTR